jgi:hypothetical protein
MYKLPFFNPEHFTWVDAKPYPNKDYTCGFCSREVSSNKGYWLTAVKGKARDLGAGIRICSSCGGPTFFTNDSKQIPAASLGRAVDNVPADLNALYEEARRCTTMACYTAAVLLCRKMLMGIAVDKKAKEGKKFEFYVDYLGKKGHVPSEGRPWIDHIRKQGNKATHRTDASSEKDATDLLTFTEMLLRTIYEFPEKMKPAFLIQPKVSNPPLVSVNDLKAKPSPSLPAFHELA